MLFASAQEMCSSTATAVCPEAWRFVRRMAFAAPAGARPTAAPGLASFGAPDNFADEFLYNSVGKWRRMILRVVARWNWAKDGLRLALIKRPDLRFLPFPVYCFAMEGAGRDYVVRNGAHPRDGWAGSRFGLYFAFLEHPFLQGMMVTSSKGRATRVRVAMVRGAGQEAAKEAAKEADRLQASQLDWPSWWVRVTEKDKVEDLKAKIRPVLGLLKGTPTTPGAFYLQRFYDCLLASFADQVCRAYGHPDSYLPGCFNYDAGRTGGGPSEHECLHVAHGGANSASKACTKATPRPDAVERHLRNVTLSRKRLATAWLEVSSRCVAKVTDSTEGSRRSRFKGGARQAAERRGRRKTKCLPPYNLFSRQAGRKVEQGNLLKLPLPKLVGRRLPARSRVPDAGRHGHHQEVGLVAAKSLLGDGRGAKATSPPP